MCIGEVTPSSLGDTSGTISLSVEPFAGTWWRSMKIARPLCLRAASRCDGAGPREGTRPVSHVRTAITYGQPARTVQVCTYGRVCVSGCGSLAENNKNPHVPARSQEAFGFAPRHAERIKLFTLDTYTKSIVEVSAIDKMNDGYTAPGVPPPLTDAINRLLQNRSFSMWRIRSLRVRAAFLRSPFWVIIQARRSPRSNRAGSTVSGERWFVNKLARRGNVFFAFSFFFCFHLFLLLFSQARKIGRAIEIFRSPLQITRYRHRFFIPVATSVTAKRGAAYKTSFILSVLIMKALLIRKISSTERSVRR